MFKEMVERAVIMTNKGLSKMQAATRISAEFPAAAYVSKGQLWAMFRNEKNEVVTRALV